MILHYELTQRRKAQGNPLHSVLIHTVGVCLGGIGVHSASGRDECSGAGRSLFSAAHLGIAACLSSDQSFAVNWRLATNPSGWGR